MRTSHNTTVLQVANGVSAQLTNKRVAFHYQFVWDMHRFTVDTKDAETLERAMLEERIKYDHYKAHDDLADMQNHERVHSARE